MPIKEKINATPMVNKTSVLLMSILEEVMQQIHASKAQRGLKRIDL